MLPNEYSTIQDLISLDRKSPKNKSMKYWLEPMESSQWDYPVNGNTIFYHFTSLHNVALWAYSCAVTLKQPLACTDILWCEAHMPGCINER